MSIDSKLITGEDSMAKKSKPPDEVQEVINALVFKHGANFINQPDAKEWLDEVKLTIEQVTPERLKAADAKVKGITMEVVHKPPTKPVREDLIHWILPVEQPFENGVSTFHIWASECGRYRVARVTGAEPRFTSMTKEPGKKAETIIKDDMASLRAALNAIDKFHNFKYNREHTKSNRDKIIQDAEETGLYDLSGSPLVQKVDLEILKIPIEEKEKIKNQTPAGKDKFGSRFGSAPAKINAAIHDEWRPFEDIVEDSKLPKPRVKAHLNWLLGLNKVEQTGNRWRVKGKE